MYPLYYRGDPVLLPLLPPLSFKDPHPLLNLSIFLSLKLLIVARSDEAPRLSDHQLQGVAGRTDIDPSSDAGSVHPRATVTQRAPQRPSGAQPRHILS